MEVTQQRIADEMRQERALMAGYLATIPEGAWDKQSLCEGWRVRDVVAHVVGNAADLSSGNTADAGSEAYNARQVAERDGRSPAELLAEWEVAGPAFEEGLLALDDAFWNTPYPPLGTVGEALQRLVEDTWVHRQDIRIALGDGVDARGPGMQATFEVALREYATRMPERAPGVGSVTIAANGSVQTVRVADAGVDVTVSGSPATIALVATGRLPLDEVDVQPSVPDGFASAFNIYAS